MWQTFYKKVREKERAAEKQKDTYRQKGRQTSIEMEKITVRFFIIFFIFFLIRKPKYNKRFLKIKRRHSANTLEVKKMLKASTLKAKMLTFENSGGRTDRVKYRDSFVVK